MSEEERKGKKGEEKRVGEERKGKEIRKVERKGEKSIGEEKRVQERRGKEKQDVATMTGSSSVHNISQGGQ